MINKEILEKIFNKKVIIENNHLIENHKIIPNWAVKKIVSEYKYNTKYNGMKLYSSNIITEGFKHRSMCDESQLYELYALSEIVNSDYLALLYMEAGEYIYLYNAVDEESLEQELILFNNEYNFNDFLITDYGSISLKIKN